VPALWRSGFRPFFLLGALFGPLALAAWYGSYIGAWSAPGPLALWHGHEMVFGFLVAIISGLLLTALPSWAGVPDQEGASLALLVGAWLAGRAAMACAGFLHYGVVAAVDTAALALLVAVLAPGLWRVPQRKFLIVLPVLAALAAAVGLIVVLYSLVGGFMTPVFTNNALREQACAHRARRSTRLDVLAHALAIAFAITHAFTGPPVVAGGVALAASIVHAARLAGWQGFRVRGNALVVGMHLGYAWLVTTFAIAALADFRLAFGPRDWIHAATIGAFGTMMLALMPRVSLRHTGRALGLARGLLPTYAAMALAALLRLAFGAMPRAQWTLAAAAMLWAACFLVYVAVYGRMLVRPSLPRSAAGRIAVS
jgi:uncharacterized protein involved in response to NO